MTVYYTNDYKNSKGESHRLLAKAIGCHIDDPVRAEQCVASLRKEERSGKPYIEGFAGFSISHSGNTWAVLICGMRCGLDVQYPRKCDILSIAERFYDKRDALSAGKDEKEFFRVWTRREALIKAAGTSVAAEDVPSVLDDRPYYDGREWKLIDISVPGTDGLYSAVCIPAEMPAQSIGFMEL